MDRVTQVAPVDPIHVTPSNAVTYSGRQLFQPNLSLNTLPRTPTLTWQVHKRQAKKSAVLYQLAIVVDSRAKSQVHKQVQGPGSHRDLRSHNALLP